MGRRTVDFHYVGVQGGWYVVAHGNGGTIDPPVAYGCIEDAVRGERPHYVWTMNGKRPGPLKLNSFKSGARLGAYIVDKGEQEA